MSSELKRIDNLQLIRHRMTIPLAGIGAEPTSRPCLPVKSLRHSAGYMTVDPEKKESIVICYECGQRAELSKTGVKQLAQKLGSGGRP